MLELCMKVQTDVFTNILLFSAKHCQIVSMRHEASDLFSFIFHAASDEQASTKKYVKNLEKNKIPTVQLL